MSRYMATLRGGPADGEEVEILGPLHRVNFHVPGHWPDPDTYEFSATGEALYRWECWITPEGKEVYTGDYTGSYVYGQRVEMPWDKTKEEPQ